MYRYTLFTSEDHPRLRGEKARSAASDLCRWGSPPLTRGKGGQGGPVSAASRITPAYAGKRVADTLFLDASQDHPRLRGEKLSCSGFCTGIPGSPPLTRGKGIAILFLLLTMRITPAYAGKRSTRQPIESQREDHPRLRGEKCVQTNVIAVERGSPPLTRGKEKYHPSYEFHLMDHPRLRGEKCFWCFCLDRVVGSPPLTRGKVKRAHDSLFDLGITPAYAGKRRNVRNARLNSRDHPRLRGEKGVNLIRQSIRPGSPPLTRGKEKQ